MCIAGFAAGFCGAPAPIGAPPPSAREAPRGPRSFVATPSRDFPGLASYGRPALRAARAAAAGSRKLPARGSLRSPAPMGAGAQCSDATPFCYIYTARF